MKTLFNLKVLMTLFSCLLITFMVNAQQVTFTNVADSMGINHMYSGVYWGGGVSFHDFDGDGFEDVSISSGPGELIYLYKNNITAFDNITPQLNLTDIFESKSVIWADYDNDGDKDLFITHLFGPNKLYRNDGNHNFIDVTASSGISLDTLASMGACWGDYDNDGWLDLYVVNYSGMPNYGDMRNYLYWNQGDGSFLDVTLGAGVADSAKYPFIAVFFDYNNDGWQDIYIANDRDPQNTLFKNMGDGTFTDVSIPSQTNLDFDAMGIAVADYNNDGWLDLYVSNGPPGNGLLRNNGDGTFTEIADSSGVAVNKACWGTNFFDYDNDSDLDLYVSASHGNTPGSADRKNVLFENLGDGTFLEASGIGLDNDNYESYGNAIGDFDNNGFCDIAVINKDANFSLWKNSGGGNNWIKIELEGTTSNRDGIGSWIEIYVGGQKFSRYTHCGISFVSQNSSIQTVGVGTTTVIDSIVIRWLSGTVDVLRNVPVNQKLHVVEGETITSIDAKFSFLHQFKLYPNYPNPFNPSTQIDYELKKRKKVSLKIYNLLGEEIRSLVNRLEAAGYHSVIWDGRDNRGTLVSSGVYIYKFEVDGFYQLKKMILLK